jgi:hypothetical protein
VAGLVFVDGSHDEAITLSVNGKPVPVALIPADAEPLNRPPRQLGTRGTGRWRS